MALRIALAGIELGKLLPLFGSGSDRAFTAARAALDELAEEIAADDPHEAADFREQSAAILRRAISEGVPFAELEEEDPLHWEVARALVDTGQAPFRTDAVDYHYVAWDALDRAVRPRLTPPAAGLLAMLVRTGRPLFGRAFSPSDLIYGYMNVAEVESLRAGLLAAYRQPSPPFTPAEQQMLPDQLTGWLGDIASRELDLWFYMT